VSPPKHDRQTGWNKRPKTRTLPAKRGYEHQFAPPIPQNSHNPLAWSQACDDEIARFLVSLPNFLEVREMEHQRLKPIQGASAREKTAFTMKTIKELLAEETSKESSVPEPMIAEPAPEVSTPPAVEAVQAAPPAPEPAAPKAAVLPTLPPLAEADDAEQVADKPRSLFGRLIGS
jgi:hypothetical protein